MERPPKLELPEKFKPYDMDLKRQLHEKADEKNYISGDGTLRCGAIKRGNLCRAYAGYATDHPGYGRCKWHGGLNTGPITAEGKAITSQNARIHGLYASVLNKRQAEIYNELAEGQVIGLEHEIYAQKAKILAYLEDWRNKWDKLHAKALGRGVNDENATRIADRMTRVFYKESEEGSRSYYHAGTIEDRALDRALNTLKRLVEAHNRLNPENTDDILGRINEELRAASRGKINISWGGSPQTRAGKDEEKS